MLYGILNCLFQYLVYVLIRRCRLDRCRPPMSLSARLITFTVSLPDPLAGSDGPEAKFYLPLSSSLPAPSSCVCNNGTRRTCRTYAPDDVVEEGGRLR